MNKIVLCIICLVLFAVPFAAARPVIDISLVSQNPQPATPGTLTDIVLKVENQGTVEARDLIVEFVEEFPFEVANGQTMTEIGFVPFLDDSEPLLVRYKLDVDDNAPDGDVPFKVRIRYQGVSGEIEEEFFLDIQSPDASLTIASVQTTPEKVLPGEEATLSLVLENAASTSLRDVQIQVDFDNVEGQPFTPTGSATSKRVNLLRTQESKVVTYTFVTDADATPQAYKIPISVEFSDNLNNDFAQSDVIGVQVGADPQIQTYFDGTTLQVGQTQGEISIEVVNQGFTDVKFLTVTTPSVDAVTVLSSSNVYVGNLDSDDFETVTFDVVTNEGFQQADFPIIVSYKDTNNREYTEEFSVAVTARPAAQSGSGGLLIGIVVVLVIVGVVFWLARRRKDD